MDQSGGFNIHVILILIHYFPNWLYLSHPIPPSSNIIKYFSAWCPFMSWIWCEKVLRLENFGALFKGHLWAWVLLLFLSEWQLWSWLHSWLPRLVQHVQFNGVLKQCFPHLLYWCPNVNNLVQPGMGSSAVLHKRTQPLCPGTAITRCPCLGY